MSETPETNPHAEAAGTPSAAVENASAEAQKPGGAAKPAPAKVPEIGGPEGPEPTRYGDWERKGICIDF